MNESGDLRNILSKNIKTAREARHITQAKLAEYADISLSYMIDIEHCKTWVSDKTLQNIAKVLNMEAYELLIPLDERKAVKGSTKVQALHQIEDLIDAKKKTIKKMTEDAMNDLAGQIIRIYPK
ncbi:hypothetical protein FACS189476_05580 [Spirochaetia bacterium]|nr:hypothetical protein FACS189476_05580 [Spirochaetia bacterium]